MKTYLIATFIAGIIAIALLITFIVTSETVYRNIAVSFIALELFYVYKLWRFNNPRQ